MLFLLLIRHTHLFLHPPTYIHLSGAKEGQTVRSGQAAPLFKAFCPDLGARGPKVKAIFVCCSFLLFCFCFVLFVAAVVVVVVLFVVGFVVCVLFCFFFLFFFWGGGCLFVCLFICLLEFTEVCKMHAGMFKQHLCFAPDLVLFGIVVVVRWLLNVTCNMLVCLKNGSAQAFVRAATQRQKLQMKPDISPSHSILTPGKPVPVQT